MDILRRAARNEFDGLSVNGIFAAPHTPCKKLTIATAFSFEDKSFLQPKPHLVDEDRFTEIVKHDSLTQHVDMGPRRATNEQPIASLELVFLTPGTKMVGGFPKPKGFSITKSCFETLFEYLRVDESLLSYLTSSRSGWYCVRGEDGCHSFLYKDYMYTLAWSFDTKSNKTRAMMAARSEYSAYSNLRDQHGNFQLPPLSRTHLEQPLALAFIALTDCAGYIEQVIMGDGYRLADIESETGYGLWTKEPGEKTEKRNPGKGVLERKMTEKEILEKREPGRRSPKKEDLQIDLEQLEKALRHIARLIGVFLALFKTIEIAVSMAKSIKESDRWKALSTQDATSPGGRETSEAADSLMEAVQLLTTRIHSVKQSGKATLRRAKAMSNVVSGLIGRAEAVSSRIVAERAVNDGSSMKVIALMTMLFLPATFISALWAVPALDEKGEITKDSFWFYWVVTVPVTLLVFGSWYELNNKKLLTWASQQRSKWSRTYQYTLDEEQGGTNTTRAPAQSPKNSGSNKSEQV